jgi:hypothetical protein
VVVDAPPHTDIYSPEDVRYAASVVAEKCTKDDYVPDVVVGLAPWLEPAHVIADALGVDRVASIQVAPLGDSGALDVLHAPRFFGPQPRLVLLVAYAFEEGAYMTVARDQLTFGGVVHVRTAALVATRRHGPINTWLPPTLDYVGEMLPVLPEFYWAARRPKNERRYS